MKKDSRFELRDSRLKTSGILVVLLCLMGVNAMAQGIAVGSASGMPGASVSAPVTFTAGSTGITAIQFDLLFPSSIAYRSSETGSATTTAGKFSSAAPIPGGVRILLLGLNTNAIGPGIIVNIQLDISSNTPPGTLPITVGKIVASDANASPVLVGAIPGNVQVLSTVLPNDATAPVITAIRVSDVTNKSAVINWSTDRQTDSVLEYWPVNQEPAKSALGDFVTQHSLTLSHLQKLTEYHFRILSTDTGGNRATSQEFTFSTPADGQSVIALPRFVLGQAQSSAAAVTGQSLDVMTGMALVNLGSQAATLTITAVDSFGSLITGAGIVNPVVKQLNPQSQIAVLDSQIFGPGLESSNSSGWIKLESTNAGVAGFYLTFDSGLTLMDGTNFGDVPMKDFAFTEIEPSGSTTINIANAGSTDAAITFNLMTADGRIRNSQVRTIPGNGALVADLYRELFSGLNPEPTDYVKMKSTEGVQSFELMQKSAGDISSLTGQDVSAGSTTLYSPQYVVGGAWKTSLSVINLDAKPGKITFRLFSEDGVQTGTTQDISILPYGKVRIDNPEFFAAPNPGQTTSGYVEIESDGIRLAGSTVFGDGNGASFSSALPLISTFRNSVLFSHVASNDKYFTGIAILNPDAADAEVTIELHGTDGTLLNSTTQQVPAKQRVAKLLTQYFESLVGQNPSGYIKLISNRPIVSYSLFGTNDLSVLSAIPPQDVQ